MSDRPFAAGPARRAARGAGLVLLAAALAAMTAAAGAALGQGRLLGTAAPVALAGVALAAIWLGELRSVLAFAAVFAVGYNRQFYSFDDLLGDFGSRGLYWVPADAVYLAMAVALLLGAAAARAPAPARRAPPGHLAVFPLFLAAMAGSTLAADALAPALFEVVRLAKLFAIALLLRWAMTERMARALLAGLGALVVVQFLLGALEVVRGTGGSGLTAMTAQESELARRAHGTLGHPNFLAPFLLTFVPGFVAMAAGARLSPARRGAVAAVAVCGCLTILLTQSRAPGAAMLGALAAVGVHLVLRGRVAAPRLVGASLGVVALALIAAAPLAQQIRDRIQGDFEESVDFRDDYNEVALILWESAPVLGIGPNHFTARLSEVRPIYAQINEELEEHRLEANFRASAPVHNLFLLILAETGVVGLAAFVVLLGALARDFLRAAAGPPGEPWAMFFLGTFWGFLAVLVQQLADYSLWWDHHLNLLVMLGAMALHVRGQRPAGVG